MAQIDSLELKISADSSKAATALSALRQSLEGLNSALTPATHGLESMAISLAKVVGMQGGLAEISKTFNSLSKSWTALNTSTSKTTTEMAGVTDKARTMSQVFAKEYGIKGKESVTELTNAFQKLYSSVGDNAAIGQSISNIFKLINTYGQLKTEVSESDRVITEMMKKTTVKLPETLRKDLGENLIKYMGKLPHVSSTIGALPSEIVKEINAAFKNNPLDSDNTTGLIDISGLSNESAILEKLIEALTAAESKTLTLKEAAQQNQDVAQRLNDQLSNLATSVGSTLTGAMDAYKSAIAQIHEISPALVEQLRAFDTTIDSIAQNGNPFEAVVSGLMELQNVHLSDSLQNITAIKEAMGKLGGDYAARAATTLPGIASALKQMDGITVPPIGEDLMNLAVGLSKLGGKKIADAYEPLIKIREALLSFNNVSVNQEAIASVQMLGDALYKFGLAKMDKAVENIPRMAQSMTALVNSLSTMPAVSDNTIRLVSALGNVNVSGNTMSNMMNGRLSSGLKKYTSNAFNARKASMSLASAFGRMYANFFIFFRLANRFKKDIDLASDLTEVQNVVDVTFGDMAEKMNEFSKAAIETLGMSELTAKKVGSRFQAMGSAMGISDSMVKSTNDFVQEATNGYADVADSIADVSINLTRLAGDMASFYNADYADVAEDLEAVYTGLTKPLRKYGIDLTQATLKEWALNHGMEANFKTMTQAEKTLLRYQYVMAQTTAAHGDFERTQSTWANQVRIATEKLNQLRIVLGKIAIYTFKPLVQSFNKAMDQIIKGAEGLLNALGKIFGWQIEWNDGGILNEEADDSEELADNMGDAADNAKKFKNFLLGIDELNVLPDNSDKDKGNGSGIGNLGNLGDAVGGFNIKPIESAFDSIYDTLFKLGARINEIIKNLLKSIDWDKVYKKARDFGRGFAEFVNGLLNDSETFYEIGKFLAGGVNTLANVIDAYHKEFDGWQLGVDIGRLVNGFTENLDWSVIKSAAIGVAHDLAQTINAAFITIKWEKVGSTIAEGLNTAIEYFYTLGSEIKWSVIGTSIASGINGFFKTFDFAKAAETLNLWAKGLLDALIQALDRTDWKRVGASIGEFIERIDFISIGAKVVHAFWEALEGAFTVYGGIFDAAPVEASLATIATTVLSSKTLTKTIKKAFRKQGKAIAGDLANVFNGTTLNTFMSGFLGLNDRGMVTEVGSVLGNLKNGFNAVSGSLSTATKAVGGLTAGFAEFFAVKNTVSDLALAISGGPGSIVESLGALITEVGLASGAFALLFGVPTGLIIAGAAAGVAAIVGVSEALDKVSEKNIISVLARDMGDAAVTLDELSSGFKTTADNITGGLEKMSAEHDKLATMKSNLSEMVGGFSLIKDAAENGAMLTAGALKELIGDLDEVKKAWEDYIRAQYDYLIQSTVNNMNFLRSQRELTEEEATYFTNKINELTEAKYRDINSTTKAAEDAEKAWNDYYDALNKSQTEVDHNGQKVYVQNLYELKQNAIEASNALYGLGEAQGIIKGPDQIEGWSDDIYDLNDAAKDFVVTLADIDPSNLSNYAVALQGFTTQYQETFDNAISKIDREKANLAELFSPEDAEIQMRTYYEALGNAAEEGIDAVQLKLLDSFYGVLAQGDSYKADKYIREVIEPVVESWPKIFDEKGNEIKPYILETTRSIYEEAFEWRIDKLFPVLTDQWQDMFWDARNKVAPEAKKTGSAIMDSVVEGATESATNLEKPAEEVATLTSTMWKTMNNAGEETDGASKKVESYAGTLDKYADSADEASKSTSKMIDSWKLMNKSGSGDKGIDTTLRAMVSFNSQAGLLSNGVIDLKKSLEDMTAKGEGIKDISTNFSGLSSMMNGFSNAFVPVKEGFGSFTTETQASMQKTTTVFGESFSSIMKYGNQTISWLKSSFVPYFSGAYWNSITSSIPNAFGNAFRQAINIMQNLWRQFATWANQNMKMNVNMRGKEVAGLDVDIPQYDTGGFPEDGLFKANHGELVGQFTNGKTAVANNEQIVEGIRQGVYDAVSSAMSQSNGNVTVELVGDVSDILTAVVKANNREIYRTGTSPIRN